MNLPQVDPWIGRTIGDRQRYRLDQRLGGGGMGDVFLAMDTLLGQQVALKLLKETLVVAEELRKRFEREVALSAALRSDHIVQISDYGVTAEGHPFYVMEYLRGESLGQLLRREKRLSVERSVSIINQVCEGLQLAHGGVKLWRDGATASEHIKVVHRDLKPDNIFLVPTTLGELVKILDFGIAKIRRNQAEYTENVTSVFLGTFHYAAPEQLGVEEDLDERADIYSLGIILYEMLTGTDPFGLGLNVRSISGVSWAMAHTSKPPQPLRVQLGCEELSPELEAVVLQCLQKLPDERFASVEELIQALNAAVGHGPTVPHLSTPSQQEADGTTTDPQRPLLLPPEASENTLPRPLTPSPDPNYLQPSTPVASGSEAKAGSGMQSSPSLPGPTIRDSRAETLREPKELSSTSSPRKSPLLLAGAGVAIAVSVTGAAYVYLNWQPNAAKILDKIRSRQAEANYVECISEAGNISEGSSVYQDAQRLLNECQIEQAKKLATGGKFLDAITIAGAISQASPLYPEAQSLVNQWSNSIMTQAKEQFQAGELDSAIAQAQTVPTTSSVHPNAQAAIAQWQTDWQLAETQYNAAQKALDQSQWQVAIDASNKVPNITFWKNKTKPIVQQAQSEIAKAAAANAAARRAYKRRSSSGHGSASGSTGQGSSSSGGRDSTESRDRVSQSPRRPSPFPKRRPSPNPSPSDPRPEPTILCSDPSCKY